MGCKFVRQAISTDLSIEIEIIVDKIRSSFGLDLSKIQASKVVAWKSKNFALQINEKKLVEILGNKHE